MTIQRGKVVAKSTSRGARSGGHRNCVRSHATAGNEICPTSETTAMQFQRT
jgi:hypothetical protein